MSPKRSVQRAWNSSWQFSRFKVPFQEGCLATCATEPNSVDFDCSACPVIRTVRATNTGNQDLVISDISVTAEPSFNEFQLLYRLPDSDDPASRVGISYDGEDLISYPLYLGPGEQIIFDVAYTPKREEMLDEDEELTASVLLQTNLAPTGRVRIPITVAEGAPRISVIPPTLISSKSVPV